MTVLAAKSAGINSLAMIHDDYGTHASDAESLYNIIREEFVKMYSSSDPLLQIKESYEYIKAVPAKGSLDLNAVLTSPYFFT
jgi:DNA-directed RNA polymerase